MFIGLIDAAGVALLPLVAQSFGESDEVSRGIVPSSVASLSPGVLIGIVVACFTVKSAVAAALSWWQIGFITRHQAERNAELYRRYLDLDYVDFTSQNTSLYVRNLNDTMAHVYTDVGGGLATLSTEALSLAAMGTVVVLVNPRLATFAAVYFGLVLAIFAVAIRRPALTYSRRTLDRGKELVKHMLEGLTAYKTVKAYGVQDVIAKRFRDHSVMYGESRHRDVALQRLPRYFLEIALIGGVLIAAAAPSLFGSKASGLASLGLVAGVASRGFPSLDRFVLGLTQVRAGAPAVDDLRAALGVGSAPAEAPSVRGPATSGALIELSGVSFTYPGAHRAAVVDIGVQVSVGEMVAIVGASGAGKTTIADLLVGLIEPTTGTVRVADGIEVNYVAQDVHLWDDSIEFNVSLDRPPRSPESHDEALARSLRDAQLAEWVATLPSGVATSVGEAGTKMSGGQRHRVGVARAMYRRSEVLVLDEPTAALDRATADGLIQTLRQLRDRAAIVVVSHSEPVAAAADRVLKVADGALTDERSGRPSSSNP